MRRVRGNLCLGLLAGAASLAGVLGCGSKLPVDYPPNMQVAMKIRSELDSGPAAATDGAAQVTPTGWATLTGKFTLSGSAPAPIQLNADKDTSVCAPGGQKPEVSLVEVDANGGLKNVLVFLNTSIPLDDPLWVNPSFDASKEITLPTPFDQKACLFLSRIFAARSSQTVVMKNSDPVAHNAKIDGVGSAKSDNFTIGANDQGLYRAGGEAPQPFPVSCSIHPWMKAWLISRDSPYFAITQPDGTFEIKDLPAAEEGLKLEFRAWHEVPKFVQKVTVDGAPVTWSKGKFSIELKPGDSKHIEVVIDAASLPKP